MHAAHAPKHVRNPRCLPRLPSAHVMRIALPPRHRSSLRQSGPARSRAPTSPRLGSRPRASDAAPGLSTRTMPMARFSEPDSGPTTSATLRRTGTRRGSWSLVRSRGDYLPAARLPARFPLGGLAWRRAALAALSEEGVARGPAESRRGSVPVRAWSPPLAPDRAPPCRAHVRSKGGTLRAATCAPDADPRGPSISRSPVPHLPAKADAFSRRPRCVRPPLGSSVRGDRSPRPFEWASRPRDPSAFNQEERSCLCDLECQRLFLPLPDARRDVPSTRCAARSIGAKKGFAFAFPSPSPVNRSACDGFFDRRTPRMG
jgi:hypothetical protein